MLKPYTIYETENFMSGKIRVTEERRTRDRTLYVNDIVQSVYSPHKVLVSGYWDEFLRTARSKHEVIKNVLVLGLGGGTSVKQFFSVYPGAHITGIEIDPKIIEVGQRFFNLAHPHLKIICADAFDWIKSEEAKIRKYDVICVDLFVGDVVPEKAESEEFFRDLNGLLIDSGTILINRIYIGKMRQKTDAFIDKLREIFHDVNVKSVKRLFTTDNVLISVSHSKGHVQA